MPKRNAPQLPDRQIVKVPFAIGTAAEFRIQRADGGELEALRVEGIASVYGYEYNVYGGPPWGWVERIEQGAFDKTLKDDPDVVFLLNHDGLPLARTKSDTMELRAGKAGLELKADLDLANPLVQTLESGLRRGDIDEMSFGFRVTGQSWSAHPEWEDDDESLRSITEVNLHRGDVSAVTFGASDATQIDIVRGLDLLSVEELTEARAAIDWRIKQETGLQPIAREQKPSGGTPEADDTGGMPAHLLELLRIPSNPLLEELTR